MVGADDDRDDPSGRGACGSGRLCRDGDYQHEHFNVGGQRTTVPLALAPLRGEFDLDLGAKGAGDFFERRQRHAIVILPIQARDVGLLHAAPPRELVLGLTLFSTWLGSNPARVETPGQAFHSLSVPLGTYVVFLCAAGNL